MRGRDAVRLLVAAASSAVAFSLLSCQDGSGPGLGRASFSVIPHFESSVAAIVPLAHARVVLARTPGGEVALDTVYDIAANQEELSLDLKVVVLTANEVFRLTIAFVDADGDTVFRGGPLEVNATNGTGSGTPTPVSLPIIYVGVGADAATIEIITPDQAALGGDTVTFVAVARRADGTVIAETPIAWRSAAEAVVRPRDPPLSGPGYPGVFIAEDARGSAAVIAELLTGQSDQASVTVQPSPTGVIVQSGGGQSGPVATALAQPLIARVTAQDGLGVSGIVVDFATGSGTLSAPAATTNASGDAQVIWTFGNLAGAQTATATSLRVRGVAAVFQATANPGPPATVLVTPPAASLASIGATQQFNATVTDQFNNAIANPALSWASTNTAAATVNLNTGLATAVANGGTTIRATSGTASGTATLTVGQTATQLAFIVQPANAVAGAAIVPPIQVQARDATGNLVSTFTGDVTLTISTNPASGTLAGTATVAAVAGVATFATLSIDNTGNGYVLQAAATGPTSTTSTAFNILASGPVTVAWTNPAGGNWSVGANWSTGTAPAAGDNVAISLAGTYTVTLDVDATVGTFTLGATTGTQTLSATANTLTLNGLATIGLNGIASIATATVAGTGTVVNQGVVNLNASTVNNTLANQGLLNTTAGVALTGSASNSGTVNVNAGILSLPGGGTHAGTFNVATGSTLQLAGTHDVTTGGGFAGTGTISVIGTLNVYTAITINNPFALNGNTSTTLGGTGNVTLAGAFNWTNGADIRGSGTLTTNGVTTISNSVQGDAVEKPWVNNGTVNMAADADLLFISTSSTITNAASGVFNQGSTRALPIGVFSGPGGSFINAGTYNKTAAGTQAIGAGVAFINTGTLNVQAGTLQVNGFPINAGTVDIAGGATLSTVNNPLANASTGVVRGSGTLDVGTALFTNGGAVNPGTSPGILSVIGNYDQTGPGGALNIELGGTTAGTEYDRLNVSGTLTRAGALNVTLVNDFTPVAGSDFAIGTFGSITPAGGSVTFPTVSGLTFNVLATTGRTPDTLYVRVTTSASGPGRIVVSHDEWTLSDQGFISAPATAQFALNIAQFFTGGGPGNFLAYSNNFGLTGGSLAATMTGAGHTWTVSTVVPFTLAELQQYDGVFLTGVAADNQVLIDYVNAGGGVYIAGGAGLGGSPATEAAAWNTFLNAFGLGLNPVYDTPSGVLPVTATHPIFAGVSSLFQSLGQFVLDVNAGDPHSAVFEGGLYGVFDLSLTGGGATQLAFTGQPSSAAQNASLGTIQVAIQDAQGQTVTSATNTVTLNINLTEECGPCPVLSGTSAVDAVNGIATFTGLAIDVVNSTYRLRATVTGLPQNLSAPFMVTPTGMTHLWTGATSVSFGTASNWSPAVVPGAGDNIFVPASAPNQPELGQDRSLNDVVIEDGADIDDEDGEELTASGNVSGGISSELTMTGTGRTLRGALNSSLAIDPGASITLAGPTSATTVSVQGSLTLGGHALSVVFLQTQGIGTLTMSSSTDVLTTTNITFAGGSTDGSLLAGVIHVAGTFRQVGTTSPSSFAPSGAHVVHFNGSGPTQDVIFGTPGSAQSHFQQLLVEAPTVMPSTPIAVTGGITLAGGQFVLNAVSGTTTTPTLTINFGNRGGDGVLEVANAMTWSSGALVGAGTTTVLSGATLTMNSAVKLLQAPHTLVNQGTATQSGPIDADGAGSLVNEAGATWTFDGAINQVNANSFTNRGVLVKTGAGDLDLGPFNNVSPGTIDVQGGRIVFRGTTSIQRTNPTTATIAAGASLVFDNPGGTVAFTSSIRFDGAGTFHVASGTVAVELDATTDLPNLLVSGGVFAITPDALVLVTGNVTTTGGTIQLDNAILEATGTVTNGPGAVIQGEGTVTASLLVNAGTLAPAGAQPILTVSGDLTQQGTANLPIEIGGTVPGFSYDRLVVTGAVTRAGALNVTLTGGFTPVVNDQFDILMYGSTAGTFAPVNLPTLGAGLGWELTETTGTPPLVLRATVVASASTLLHSYSFTADANDETGTENGTLLGGAAVSGGALALGQAGGYAEFPSHVIPTGGDYSVALFVRHRVAQAVAAAFISQAQTGAAQFVFGHSGSREIRAGFQWGATGVTAAAADGQFHHYALVVSGSTPESRLYVDGVLEATIGTGVTSGVIGTNTRLGRSTETFGDFLDGDIDDVKIYSGALSGAEVAALAGSRSTGSTPNAWTGGGGASDTWSNPANWSLGRVPLPTDDVVINLVDDFAVNLDQDATVASLNMGGPGVTVSFDQAAQVLTVNGTVVVGQGATYNLSGGTLFASGDITIEEELSWSGGTIAGSGLLSIVAGGTASLSGGVKTLSGKTLQNQGTVGWSTGNIVLASSAAVSNEAAGTWFALGDATMTVGDATPHAFTNDGTLIKSGGTGSTSFVVSAINNNAVQVTSGTLTFGNNEVDVHSGTFTGDPSATLAFSGTGTHTLNGPVTGFGTVTTSNGDITFNGAITASLLEVGVFGAMTVNSDLAGVAAVMVRRQLTIGTGQTLNAGTTWTIQSGSTLTLNASGQTFVLARGVNIGGTGTLIVGAGTLHALPDATYSLPNVMVTGGGTFLVPDTDTDVTTVAVNGNLDIGGTGLLAIGSFATVSVTGTFTTFEQGTMTMPAGGSGSGAEINIALAAVWAGGSTAGLLDAGTITVGGDFTQSSTNSPQSFAQGAGGTTVLNGGVLQTLAFETLGADGSHFGNLTIFNGSNANVAPPIVNIGAVVDGNLLLLDAATSLTGTQILVSGNATVGANATLGIGTFSIQGDLVVDPAATFNVLFTALGDVDGTPLVVPDLPYQNLQIFGQRFATASLDIANDLSINGIFNPNGNFVGVGGNFSTVLGTGILDMRLGGDVVVGGNATWEGADGSTFLTGGEMRIAGNFAQLGVGHTFTSEGTAVVFDGTNPRTIAFANPGAGAGEGHFFDLIIDGLSAGDVTFLSPVFANRQFVQPRDGAFLRGNGNVLTARGLQLGQATPGDAITTFDNLRLVVVDGAPMTQVNDAVFINMNPEVTQVQIVRNNGSATFNNFEFDTAPTTGLYLHLDAPTEPFTLTMNNTSPANWPTGTVLVTNQALLVGWDEETGGDPTQLAFVTQPVNTPQNVALGPIQVAVQNSAGQTVTTDNTTQVTLGFASLTQPGATLSGTLTQTVVAGVATFTGLSIDSVATASLGAESGLLTAAISDVFFSTPPGMTHLWTGAVSLDFHTAGNWSPATVPAAGDNIFLSFLNSAVLATNVTIGDVFTDQGALEIPAGVTLTVAGNFRGRIQDIGDVAMSGTGRTLDGDFATGPLFDGPDLRILPGASITLGANTAIRDSVTVEGSLALGGHTLTVFSTLTTTGTGQFLMDQPTDNLVVTNLVMGGGTSAAAIVNGTIQLSGDFTQATTGAVFAPVGAHQLVFTGPGIHAVTFQDQDPVESFFNNVTLNEGTVNVPNPFHVVGTFTMTNGILNINGTSDPNTMQTFVMSGGTRAGPGDLAIAASFAWNGGTLTGASETSVLPGATLPISGSGTVGAGTAKRIAGGHTLLNFGTATWTGPGGVDAAISVGGASTLVNEAGATFTVSVPNQILKNLAGTFDFQNNGLIQATSGGIVRIFGGFTNAGQIQVTNGSFSLAQSSLPVSLGGTVTITSPGTMDFHDTVDGVATLANGLSVTGTGTFQLLGGTGITVAAGATVNLANLTISDGTAANNAILTIPNATVNVSGNFTTALSGTFVMNNAASVLTVGGSFTAGGGSTDTRLTDGTLSITGSFNQTGVNSTSSFAPSTTHRTRFVNAGAKTITFANAGTAATQSHFHNLEFVSAAGAVTLNSNVFANGTLIANPAATPVTVSGAGNTLEATALDVQGLSLNRVQMRLVAATNALPTFNNVTFTNYVSGDVQFSILHPGNATTMSFTNLVFTPTLDLSILYMRAEDSAVDGTALTITVTHEPNPAGGQDAGAFHTLRVGTPLPTVTWQT